MVRSSPNRRTLEGPSKKDTSAIQSHLEKTKPSAEVRIRKGNKVYKCDFKSTTVILADPQRHPAASSNVLTHQKINLVEVRSKSRTGEGPHWRLLTNLEIDSCDDVLRVIEIFRSRWFIEYFHRVLKSGFGVEKSRLSTRTRLENMASVMSVASWYIFWLYNFGRTAIPNAVANAIFSEDAILEAKVSFKGKIDKKKSNIYLSAPRRFGRS